MTRRAASVKRLLEIKDVTEEDAQEIRNVWKTCQVRGTARNQIDIILRTHGVEYLGYDTRSSRHIYYCNAGDSYATTIIFTGGTMSVGCWADIAERKGVKQENP